MKLMAFVDVPSLYSGCTCILFVPTSAVNYVLCYSAHRSVLWYEYDSSMVTQKQVQLECLGFNSSRREDSIIVGSVSPQDSTPFLVVLNEELV